MANLFMGGAIVYDINNDRFPDVLFAGNNLLLQNNQGKFFTRKKCYKKEIKGAYLVSLVSDFNQDGLPDLVGIPMKGKPVLHFGKKGKFPFDSGQLINVEWEPFYYPSVITSGDVDGDGDLDLWLGQWRNLYVGVDSPKPYFNANNGYPSYLLLNDGLGNFRDATVEAGLDKKRFRRTFSASLLDLDEDGDLDLLTVNDFAGVDVYYNNGEGKFKDVTNDILEETHLFGMSHTFGDYNQDGRLDFYVTGMGSTTARRLVQMGLGHDAFPDHNRMRMKMAYGNRMYLNQGKVYREPAYRDKVARSGWAWGSTSFDFDNDGDTDIYIANGHISGKSAQDYCTHFWRHDIYDYEMINSDAGLTSFYAFMHDSILTEISWNGYEHNHLFMNLAGQDFREIGWLMGVAFEYDSKAAISVDYNLDGRVDLLVTESHFRQPFDSLHLYQNNFRGGQAWIGFQFKEEKSKVSPIGTIVRLTAGGKVWVNHVVNGDSFGSQHPLMLHFGLGEVETVDQVEIKWPNGKKQFIKNPEINKYHFVD